MSVCLQTKDLVKRYRDGELDVEVLRGVNLTVETGEFVSIRGVSGAGKSTLLNLLGALDTPDSGDIIVDGMSIREYQRRGELHIYRNAKTGLIFQNHYLMPDFSVIENVMMPLLIRGENGKKARIAAQEMLERVGLAHRTTHFPEQISGGESQRVAVARAMVHKPPLILADEPTGNLDSKNRGRFIDLLARLQGDYQLTVIVVTHEDDLANAARTQYLMAEGSLVQTP
ncbi:MAG: ABC transporter ATP-binding protein [Leptospiraceae bacterium]|nr:ABC transporter ATP-binding protein [Leptospiraceae bacterium]